MGFPSAFGAVDGTLIPLLECSSSIDMESQRCLQCNWDSWKQSGLFADAVFHPQLAALIVCSSDNKILDVACRWPGSKPDLAVIKETKVWTQRQRYLEAGEALSADKGKRLEST